MLHVLKIEIDGHFHGGPPVKPWVARIDGASARYGLARTFIDPMNDWRDARRAWSGNVYGRVATWHLPEGHIYEVQRCRGAPARRHIVRELFWCASNEMHELEPEEALDRVEELGDGAVSVLLRDDARPRVGRVVGVGTPPPVGFLLRGTERLYRLGQGLVYEERVGDRRRLLRVVGGGVEELDEAMALGVLGWGAA